MKEIRDEDKTPLQAAANRLWHKYFDSCPGIHPFISSIVIAAKGEYNDTDRIYVFLARKLMHHEGTIPKTWEGFPVETKVVGRMRML